jgi:hypothetical protein
MADAKKTAIESKESADFFCLIFLKSLPRIELHRRKCRFRFEVPGPFPVYSGCAVSFPAL